AVHREPLRTRLLEDLLHDRDVELPRIQLVGVALVGDARDGKTVDVDEPRVEVDTIGPLRSVLGLHDEAEEMLAERLVAEDVLERQAHAGTEWPGKLERVDVPVLGDRQSLRGAELADPAERHPLPAVGGEEPDLLTARGDAAEVRDAVCHRAATLAVYPLGQEAAHGRLQVEHQVLPELT